MLKGTTWVPVIAEVSENQKGLEATCEDGSISGLAAKQWQRLKSVTLGRGSHSMHIALCLG